LAIFIHADFRSATTRAAWPEKGSLFKSTQAGFSVDSGAEFSVQSKAL
jgi:hypothetical protein